MKRITKEEMIKWLKKPETQALINKFHKQKIKQKWDDKTCELCDNPVAWIRHTQFSGKFLFCQKCAELEEDFGKTPSDFDSHFWTKSGE